MRTVCIVQARMGSKRLPGKVLLPLNGHTVVEEVLTRCKKIVGIDEVVCAVPHTQENDRLALTAEQHVRVSRGPEDDVLARYAKAAVEFKAQAVMRITADCPLISPDICKSVLEIFQSSGADYASNLNPRMFPQGMDCEVFTATLLEVAAGHGFDEHVTTWMRLAPIRRAYLDSPWRIDGRLTLDTEDDYKVMCAYFNHKPYEAGVSLRAA